jgi:hypothetical protein
MVYSQSVQKVKKQPSGRLVLCLSGLTKALPLFSLIDDFNPICDVCHVMLKKILYFSERVESKNEESDLNNELS